jgi:hypothetical protein
VTLGWAVIGLLIGHVAAYDVVFPDAHVHAAALADSGHAWLGMLEPSLVVAIAFVVAASWWAARAGRPRVVRFRRLAVVQVAAFVSMELGERVLAGHALADVGHELVDHGLWLILVVGIAFQLLGAWLGSAVSRGIAGVAGRVPGKAQRRSHRPPLLSIPARVLAGGSSPHRRSRAPPLRLGPHAI